MFAVHPNVDTTAVTERIKAFQAPALSKSEASNRTENQPATWSSKLRSLKKAISLTRNITVGWLSSRHFRAQPGDCQVIEFSLLAFVALCRLI
jgi:hypothetical protein